MRYEPESRTLVIVFRGERGAYRYYDVPLVEWVAFRGARSKGTYLNEVFKAKAYRCEKLEGPLPRLAAEGGDSQERGMQLEWGEVGELPGSGSKDGLREGKQVSPLRSR